MPHLGFTFVKVITKLEKLAAKPDTPAARHAPIRTAGPANRYPELGILEPERVERAEDDLARKVYSERIDNLVTVLGLDGR